jgi:hypothetical protein
MIIKQTSDSEATAMKSSSLSVIVIGVSCLLRVLWWGIEDGCSGDDAPLTHLDFIAFRSI